MSMIQDLYPAPQPWETWPPEPDIDLFEGVILTVPWSLVPCPDCQTNRLRIEAGDIIDGELCYYAVAEDGNSWATWLTLDEAVDYFFEDMVGGVE